MVQCRTRWLPFLAVAIAAAGGPASARQAFTPLYGFSASPDGNSPQGRLTANAGNFYGITERGGSGNCGTIFKINNAAATRTTVYNFTCGVDGALPLSTLLFYKGALYGTTLQGGQNNDGAIYRFDPAAATLTTLHSFAPADGISPWAGLTLIKSLMYGTATAGAQNGHGSVYSIDPADGTYVVMHSFTGADGDTPYAGLTSLNGKLWGTTLEGGSNNAGVVYAIDPKTSAYVVWHGFGAADGTNPYAALTAIGGLLYGTTYGGGQSGSGTVYSVDPATGDLVVLHNFNGLSDGGLPIAGVVALKGLLYGATFTGGMNDYGALFSVDPVSHHYRVLHDFANGADGEYPTATLLVSGKFLYGSTELGGAGSFGEIFKLKP